MNRRALTLTEVLVAAVLLVVVAIPIMSVLRQSRQSLSRTDLRREIRHFTSEILAHAASQPLHDLWDYYGPGEVVGFDTAGKLKHQLADLDPSTGHLNGENPLGFSPEFFAEMAALNLEARLHFEFYSRSELGLDAAPLPDEDDPDTGKKRPARTVSSARPPLGILHMQAGYARVDIYDRATLAKNRAAPDKALISRWGQPVMCPAVVGRPGLRLASCPAVNARTRAKYLPLLAMREGF